MYGTRVQTFVAPQKEKEVHHLMNLSIIENLDFRSELQAGLEPATFSLRMKCSTN